MLLVQQIAFILLSVTAIWLFARNAMRIRKNILLGKEENYSDQSGRRWKNVLLLAFGQKKMFRNPMVAILHFFIYAGFIIINLEVFEIFLDGILGSHRIFAMVFSIDFYNWLIDAFEFLALAVLIACVVFLCRRNILKLRRFISSDLNGWPRSDANYILIAEIILMTLFLFFDASDSLLQQRNSGHYIFPRTGDFMISRWLHPLLNGLSNGQLHRLEKGCWWLHITGIFAFLNYLPYSKHLHILLAFPNAYYARLWPEARMRNMKSVQQEVLYAMHPETAPAATGPEQQSEKFGAKDVFDLSWRNLLDAYACTECGRCTAACPANITGKKLSPRKIMMDTRDRLEEVGRNRRINGSYRDDGKKLLRDYISVEELRACTSCNACVEECPVSISPLEIILELRRSLVMEDSDAPPEWNAMFSNVENNSAPWKFSPDERDAWKND
jgi:heterodisulfide reductase subunit C